MTEAHPVVIANNTPRKQAIPITMKLRPEDEVETPSSDIRMATTPPSSATSLSIFHMLSYRTVMWWHRRDQAPISRRTFPPVATHALIVKGNPCCGWHRRLGEDSAEVKHTTRAGDSAKTRRNPSTQPSQRLGKDSAENLTLQPSAPSSSVLRSTRPGTRYRERPSASG